MPTGLNTFDLSQCDSLPPGKRAIYRGESGITECRRQAFLRSWFIGNTDIKPVIPDPKKIARLTRGVGTHLKLLLKELGVNSDLCGEGCGSFAAQMDGWGIEGCIKNREAILERLRQRYKETSWKTSLNAAWQTIVSGKVFEMNVLNPIEWLVDEAIRRAEAEATEGLRCRP